jgi:hypothetical protein
MTTDQGVQAEERLRFLGYGSDRLA